LELLSVQVAVLVKGHNRRRRVLQLRFGLIDGHQRGAAEAAPPSS